MARTMEIWLVVEMVVAGGLGDQNAVRPSVSQGLPILACYSGPPFSLPPARPQSPVSCLCFIQHHFHCDLSSTPHPPKLKPRTSKNTHTSNSGKKRRCCAGGGWGGGQNVVDPTNQQTAVVKKKKKDWKPHIYNHYLHIASACLGGCTGELSKEERSRRTHEK